MKLGIIVTEFPKITETFIVRDILHFSQCGHDVRIYHLANFRKNEIIHDFAKPTLAWTRPQPFLIGINVFKSIIKTIVFKPIRLIKILAELIYGFRGEPLILLKSLFLLPKCMAFSVDLEKWNVDHIHAEFAGHPATCAWVIGRLTNLPYSSSCRAHDIFRTQAMLDKKLFEAAFVRTISNYNKKFLIEKIPVLSVKEIAVIHSSINTNNYPFVPPVQSSTLRLLYVGSLEIRKGIIVLLKALKILDSNNINWSCKLIGSGPEEKKLKNYAKELDLSGELEFCGPRSFEDVSKSYIDANVVVTPSIIGPDGRTEGIPNVVIESLGHARPVITTRVSGIPELITHKETGYLTEPGDYEATAKWLIEIFKKPEDAWNIAKAGREKVKAEFDLEKNANKQLALFDKYKNGHNKG